MLTSASSAARVLAAVCVALVLPTAAAAQIRVDRVNPRPRMLFAPGEFQRFASETTGARRAYFDRLVAEIEQRGTRAWNERDLQLESQALVGRVFLDRGDRRGQTFQSYASNSLTFFLNSHTYTRWSTSHDIVTMGYRWLEAVSFVYDWLHPYWSPAEREAMAVWLREEIDHWIDSRRLERSSPSPFRNDAARGVAGLLAAGLTLFDEPGFGATARRAIDHALVYYEDILRAHAHAGAGGGMAEGTFYGNFTAWSQVIAAELLYTAAGDSAAYTRSPFYAGRLRYALFGSWPGYVTNQFNHRVHQLAPVFGDARRGPTGSALYHRAIVLLLGKRLAQTPAATHAYWAVTRPELERVHLSEWSLLDLLFWSPDVHREPPTALSYREETLGQVFGRSDWTDGATWFSFNAGPHLDTHQHYDAGNLTIYRGTDLIVDSGSFDNFGTPHWYNYYARTVAHNTITVTDPAEKWKGIWSGVPDGRAVNDGGQRAQAPLTPAPTLGDYLANRTAYDHGRITRHGTGTWGVYIRADLTNAYQNAEFQSLKPDGTPNRPKVAHVGREVLYLRREDDRRDAFIVLDRVIATDPSFRKAVLWHGREPFQTTARAASGDESERIFNVTNPLTFSSRVSFAEGSLEKRGRVGVTIVPLDSVRVRQIGARPSTGEQVDHVTFGINHHHRHLKDFYVADPSITNQDANTGARGRPEWPPFAPPETSWLFRDELAGGWGRTRLEVEPASERIADRFVTVLVPSDADDEATADVRLVRATSGDAAAVIYRHGGRPQVAIFTTEPSGGDLGAVRFELPVADADLYVVDLAPGLPYNVTTRALGGQALVQITPAATGTAADASGMLRLRLGADGVAERSEPTGDPTSLGATSGSAGQLRGAVPSGASGPVPGQAAAPAARHPKQIDVMPVTPTEIIAWERYIDDLVRDGVLQIRESNEDPARGGRIFERLQQHYRGVPIYGGELARQTDGRRTLWLGGTLYRDVEVDVQPRLTPAEAATAARRAAGLPDQPRAASSPRMMVLPHGDGQAQAYRLVYEVNLVTATGRATYMVDAQTGEIALKIERSGPR